MKTGLVFLRIKALQVTVVFLKTGTWYCMELKNQLFPVIPVRNQFLPVALNARMAVQDQELTSAGTVNTLEVVPAM